MNFSEFCYKEKYGYPQLQMLKAKGCPLPYVAPPDWYVGPEIEEQKARAAENASMLPSREDIRSAAQALGIPLNLSAAERNLRVQLAQNGIEDLRTNIPRGARTPSDGSGSDSDLSVTPGLETMRVGG